MKKIKTYSEDALYRMIETRHRPPAWACFPSVRSQTRYSGNIRTADAIAMSLWPSRGLELHGFEIKSTVADFRLEIRNPEKAEEIARFCHRWWIVAPKGVATLDDLPPTWGLYEASNGKLRISKQADPMAPEPLTHAFLGALLRKVQEGHEKAAKGLIHPSEIQQRLDEEHQHGVTAGESNCRYELKRLRTLAKRVAVFEKQAGVELGSWRGPEEMAELFKVAEALRHRKGAKQAVDRVVNSLKLTSKLIAKLGTEAFSDANQS